MKLITYLIIFLSLSNFSFAEDCVRENTSNQSLKEIERLKKRIEELEIQLAEQSSQQTPVQVVESKAMIVAFNSKKPGEILSSSQTKRIANELRRRIEERLSRGQMKLSEHSYNGKKLFENFRDEEKWISKQIEDITKDLQKDAPQNGGLISVILSGKGLKEGDTYHLTYRGLAESLPRTPEAHRTLIQLQTMHMDGDMSKMDHDFVIASFKVQKNTKGDIAEAKLSYVEPSVVSALNNKNVLNTGFNLTNKTPKR